ncbi:mCG1026702 [Mus musculus]|nr:mCG1026702 [Mus musculus]
MERACERGIEKCCSRQMNTTWKLTCLLHKSVVPTSSRDHG